MLQNSQAKAHTNSAKQRLSETQYLKNEKRRKQRQYATLPVCLERNMLPK